MAAALDVQLSIGSATVPGIKKPITGIDVRASIGAQDGRIALRSGRLKAEIKPGKLEAVFEGNAHSKNAIWFLDSKAELRQLTASDESGRYAAEQLALKLDVQAQLGARELKLKAKLQSDKGQIYVEPVFLDLGAAPLQVDADIRYDRAARLLHLPAFVFRQTGVGVVRGNARFAPGSFTKPSNGELLWEGVEMAAAFTHYVQPFLAGARLEKLAPEGVSRGRLSLLEGKPDVLELELKQAKFEWPSFNAGLSGVDAQIHWAASKGTQTSLLSWSGGHLAKLALGSSRVRFRAQARDFELLENLRLPLADGALKVNRLKLSQIGAPDLAAQFDAEIEPIDLAALCRAFGWPEFGGELSGRLPGVSLSDQELRLDGALRAKAFDGDITVESLRVLDPLGRLPRMLADVRMRNLDLAAITGAFSFGRIDGRINADVEGLRLLDWRPVAFKARLYTPPGDRSRHRISQRAIDNISSIGGGPTGVLSRGVLRFFDDFAYDRIGWSCELKNNVCYMGGIEPAKNGGYVLVKGRLLPRIDVVGFRREVDWNTFLYQLQAAREADKVEVR